MDRPRTAIRIQSSEHFRTNEKLLGEVAAACRVPLDLVEDVYACTPLQIGYMVDAAVNEHKRKHVDVVSLAESVEVDKFLSALHRVIELNAILRTRIADSSKGLVQVVTRRKQETQRLYRDLDQYVEDEKSRPMHLGSPMLRTALIGRKLVITVHHALVDGWTNAALLRDVMRLYRGQQPEQHVRYKDFVQHCLNFREDQAKAFWAEQYSGYTTIFPTVWPQTDVAPSETQHRFIELLGLGITVSVALLPSIIEAAWAVTVHSYTKDENITFGLLFSGRTAGFESVMGPTVAPIPVQVNLRQDISMQELARDRTSSRRQIASSPNLHYGLAKIAKVSDEARAATKFQTLLSIRSEEEAIPNCDEHELENEAEPIQPYALNLVCIIHEDNLTVQAGYDPRVIGGGEMSRLLDQFEHVLQTIVDSPMTTKLQDLQLLNSRDQDEVLEWNKTVPPSIDICVHELFEKQAAVYATDLAVEAADGSATYEQLDAMSSRLAAELRRRGIGPESRVPFMFEKSLWAMVAMLGVLKAGGACVPIYPEYPRSRKQAILMSTEAEQVLVSAFYATSLKALSRIVLIVDAATIASLPQSDARDGTIVTAGNAAYVLFTSGSTGVPRGVVLEHRNLASMLTYFGQKSKWWPGLRMLQYSNYVWDTHILEVFGTLVFGGCVCIPSDEQRSATLGAYIKEKEIEWAFLTPTTLCSLSPEEVPELETVVSCGEPVDSETMKKWSPKVQFINAWGTCETSICSTLAELNTSSPHHDVIGTAVGCAIWIVDSNDYNKLAPIGAVGELIVEGAGVARGYLNTHSRTPSSFIRPPAWIPKSRRRNENRLYRTGDLARYNADGSIRFVGRCDTEIRIKGQTLELGEIEGALRSIPTVRHAFVTTKESPDDVHELVAVLSLDDDRLPSKGVLQELSHEFANPLVALLADVKTNLVARLPAHMIPSTWFVVEKLPHTTSGKLNRAATTKWLKLKVQELAAARPPSAPPASTVIPHTPPHTAVERLLQTAWSFVLNVPEHMINRESTFKQFGGDSIAAMRISAQCRQKGFELSIAAQLQDQSLAAVAELCHPLDTSAAAEVLDVEDTSATQLKVLSSDIEATAPATDLQTWSIAISKEEPDAFINTIMLDLAGPLDLGRILQACAKVLAHHAILRTVFVEHESKLFQVVLKRLPVYTILAEGTPKTHVSPETDLLPRFYVRSEKKMCTGIRLVMHQAYHDAISMDLLLQDLVAAYEGQTLSSGPEMHEWAPLAAVVDCGGSEHFWADLLRGCSMTRLASCYDDADCDNDVGGRVAFTVPVEALQPTRGGPADVLKAAWALVLSRATGPGDIVFMEGIVNRSVPLVDMDQSRAKGPCLNFVPVRVQIGVTRPARSSSLAPSRSSTSSSASTEGSQKSLRNSRSSLLRPNKGRRDTTASVIPLPDLPEGEVHPTAISSIIRQVHEQSKASQRYSHFGFSSIFEAAGWSASTSFGSVVVYHHHEPHKSRKMANVNMTVESATNFGKTAEVWIIAHPLGADKVSVELRSCTLSGERLQAFARVLEETIAHAVDRRDKVDKNTAHVLKALKMAL